MESKTFLVPNIGCDGCVRTVENELKDLAGVTNARAEVDSKMVTVEWGEPASWQQIVDALTEIDYAPSPA
jgi:copper chaperone CopZ